MGQAVHGQHPAVVTRSQFNLLRALLAAALIVVIGLTVAVVILAGDEGQLSDTSSAAPTGHINYGGFDPAAGRPESAPQAKREAQASAGSTRYDGGPEEGTRGAVSPGASSNVVPTTRYDGGPEEGSRGSGR
jgi:hypothetical protein